MKTPTMTTSWKHAQLPRVLKTIGPHALENVAVRWSAITTLNPSFVRRLNTLSRSEAIDQLLE